MNMCEVEQDTWTALILQKYDNLPSRLTLYNIFLLYSKHLIQFCQHLDKIRYYNNIYHFDRHAFFIFYLQLLLVHVAARRAKFVWCDSVNNKLLIHSWNMNV